MKKGLFLVFVLAMSACADKTETATVQGLPGAIGPQGPAGANGHSLVSLYRAATLLECSTSGTALDIYVDLDDSLSATEGDLYENSLIACNGVQGIQGDTGQAGPQGDVGPQGLTGDTGAIGPAGPQGVAGPTGPTGPTGPAGAQGLQGLTGATGPAGPSSSDTITVYANNNSCTAIAGTSYHIKLGILYSNTGCSSFVTNIDDGDSFWVNTNMLAVDNNGSGIRVITFN